MVNKMNKKVGRLTTETAKKAKIFDKIASDKKTMLGVQHGRLFVMTEMDENAVISERFTFSIELCDEAAEQLFSDLARHLGKTQ
jgi:hypothetical protein